MENIRGKSLKEWKEYSDKDRHNIPLRTQKYIVCLEERIEQLLIQRVVGRSEQLQSFVSDFYEWHKKQNYVSIKREDWDDYIKTL